MESALKALRHGLVIPACPLALNSARKLDERRQRALVRYYAAAGAGGLAVGVHTTQFAIRDPKIGLFGAVMELVAEELKRSNIAVRIGGVCGPTAQALSEVTVLKRCGYHAALLSLAALKNASEDALIEHCRAVADAIPVIGFYLQPSVGGRPLSHAFWRRFAEIGNVVAIKIAPFNRYQTIDVVRAVAETGRDDIALYTGNDDNIVVDLLTEFRSGRVERRIVGGLLGHWAVWTRKAVELHDQCRSAPTAELLTRNIEVTDCNAAFFDAPNGFAGCIAGIHEVLRRQGLLEGIWCLDPNETLSRGQAEEIDRVYAAYPHLNDDAFVRQHIDQWLR
ncbi:MAG TPA: dihydrodipicolinate synthase family protein [Verrucomicrobiae bacterium]|nr:dihydrodipicolinate synthase family protein [Verrucomicrobiae bacterium]